MINVILSNFYRVTKSKGFKRSIVALLLFFMVITVMAQEVGMNLGIISVGWEYGYIIKSDLMRGNIIQLVEPMFSFTPIIFIVMLVMISEVNITSYRTGMTKLLVAYGIRRERIYLGNLISNLILVLGLGLAIMLVAVISWSQWFTTSYAITREQIHHIFVVVGSWCAIMSAQVSIWTLLATLISDRITLVGFGVLSVTIISPSIILGLTQPMIQVIPDMMMLQLGVNPLENVYLDHYIINSVILIILTTIVGCEVFKRKDLK